LNVPEHSLIFPQVIFLHGGPGGSTNPSHAEYFDPTVYRVVLYDQRGCGKSLPFGETEENTTQFLIQDLESLRIKLAIKKWHTVFGGSWGSTLALAYSQTHSEMVGCLVLRGIFLGERDDVQDMLDGGLAGKLYPQEYEDFVNYLPERKRKDILNAYYALISGSDKEVAFKAAMAFGGWAMLTESLVPLTEFLATTPKDPHTVYSDKFKTQVLGEAGVITHYFVNGCFLEDRQLLKNADKIKHIPTTIVHGRYDIQCPPTNAWRLHKALPGSRLFFSGDAGHLSKVRLLKLA
jgi:proline iminopeptidase